MEKPELGKYGLTQKDIDNHIKQKEQFDREYKRHIEYRKKVSVFVGASLTILLFILLLVSDRFKQRVGDVFILMIVVVLPAIALISYIVYNLMDEEQRIKAKYISDEIENKYKQYINAVKEYELYQKKIARDYWINMTGLQFEKEVASLFRIQGYDTSVTSATGDGGVDIILRKNGERIAVQCKHHSKPVGPNDVRALQGVVAAQNYSKGIFVSLNGYTTTVRSEIRNGNVDIELLELKDILIMAKGEPQSRENEHTFDLERKAKIQKMKSYTQEQLNNLLGNIVIHNKFGEGKVVEISQDYLSVDFFGEIKKFSYPNAFLDKYLTFKD